MILFADDTNIFYSNNCLKKLNEIIQIEINKIAEWLSINKLSINTSKTKFILFRSHNKKQKLNTTIIINNENITFLGIIIDECLTWKDHIVMVSKILLYLLV